MGRDIVRPDWNLPTPSSEPLTAPDGSDYTQLPPASAPPARAPVVSGKIHRPDWDGTESETEVDSETALAGALIDAIFDKLPSNEADAFDARVDVAPRFVKSYLREILTCGLYGETLNEHMWRIEENMNDEQWAECDTWWNSLTKTQRNAARDVLGLSYLAEQ